MKKAGNRRKSGSLLSLSMAAVLLLSPLGGLASTAGAEGAAGQYATGYSSWQAVLDAEAQLNRQIGAEGFVLLKNGEGGLPYGTAVRDISVFGKNSVNPVYSGSGSSGGTPDNTVGILDSLKSAGFRVNPVLEGFYSDEEASGPARPSMGFSSYNYHSYFPTAETPQDKYTDAVKASYDDYSDAAVIVISRTGGEGTDLPRTSYVSQDDEGKVPESGNARVYPTFDEAADGGYVYYGGEGRTSDPHEHYLELDDNEEALINEVTARFDKVVLIVNSSNAMELDREIVVNNDKIQSVIFAPGAGQNGFDAIGKILSGAVTPSGRLTDTFAADFTQDPTWQNFGNNNIGVYLSDTAGNQYTLDDGTPYKNNFENGVFGVEYEEGVYVGYKYYETRGFTDGDAWYDAAVNYPFGYGLSYTEFEWMVGEARMDTPTLTPETKISVDVTVTNTGMYAGKDVVQLYFSAPYAPGQTEKSHVVLGAFEKTALLRPSESQTLTLSFDAFDMASFDAYDKDGDGHKGFELDAGSYDLYIGKNAHDAWKNGEKRTLTGTDQNIDNDLATGAEIKVLFQASTDEMEGHVLSRSDWEGTFPKAPAFEDLAKDEAWLKNLDMPLIEGATPDNAVINPGYDEGSPWYSAAAPAFAAQAYTQAAPIQLSDMTGLDYDDPKWDEFLSQLTVDQAYGLMEATQFQFNGIPELGIPVAGHSDGCAGLTGAWVGGGDALIKPFASDTKFSFGTETLVGCTWNKDLAHEQGVLVGEYGLWAHIVGWYAPGGNIHRSPFSGRNFEYYSEDATLSAYMLSEVVAGARSKGMVTFMKHYALNDQESNRDTNGVAVWADEQTMRENYFKVFEWAVKKGGSNGAMSAFNRIGFQWTGANYAFLTQLTREEWGFKGMVITDAHGAGEECMNANQMIRAGNDMSLDSREGTIARIVNSPEANTPTQLTALHNAAKHILYTQANSAAMAFIKDGSVTYALSDRAVTEASVRPGEAVDLTVSDGTEGARYIVLTGALPDGLAVTDGKITGTVADTAKAGAYTVGIAKLYPDAAVGQLYRNSATGGFGLGNTAAFTVTVTENGANAFASVGVEGMEKIGSIGSVDYYAFVLSDGTEYYYTVSNGGAGGAVSGQGVQGPEGPRGEKGDKGDPGEAGGGILVTIAVSLIVSLAVFAAATVAVPMLKEKKRERAVK